jgi:ribosomal protein L13E
MKRIKSGGGRKNIRSLIKKSLQKEKKECKENLKELNKIKSPSKEFIKNLKEEKKNGFSKNKRFGRVFGPDRIIENLESNKKIIKEINECNKEILKLKRNILKKSV